MRIREWREFRGLTQDALAELVGVRNTTISRWENYHPDKKDTRAASVLEQLVLAEALGIEPADLHRNPTAEDADDDFAQIIRDKPPEWRERMARVIRAMEGDNESGDPDSASMN